MFHSRCLNFCHGIRFSLSYFSILFHVKAWYLALGLVGHTNMEWFFKYVGVHYFSLQHSHVFRMCGWCMSGVTIFTKWKKHCECTTNKCTSKWERECKFLCVLRFKCNHKWGILWPHMFVFFWVIRPTTSWHFIPYHFMLGARVPL